MDIGKGIKIVLAQWEYFKDQDIYELLHTLMFAETICFEECKCYASFSDELKMFSKNLKVIILDGCSFSHVDQFEKVLWLNNIDLIETDRD